MGGEGRGRDFGTRKQTQRLRSGSTTSRHNICVTCDMLKMPGNEKHSERTRNGNIRTLTSRGKSASLLGALSPRTLNLGKFLLQ